MRSKIDKILQEIGGLGNVNTTNTRTKYTDPTNSAYGVGQNNTNSTTPTAYNPTTPCNPANWPFPPAHWQVRLCERTFNLQDTFVNIAPAAGKTTPVINGWKGLVKRATFVRDIPRILWVCPTAQLATQVYHTDMKPTILSLLERWNDDILQSALFFTLPPRLQESLTARGAYGPTDTNANDYYMTNENMRDIRDWIDNWAVVLRATGQVQGNRALTESLFAAVCTYEYAPDLFRDINPQIVVIDEIQEYTQPTSYSNQESITSKANALHKLLKRNPRCIMLMTGSMHSEIAQQICDQLNDDYRRTFSLFDPQSNSTRNRAEIEVIPDALIEKHSQLAEIIKDCVRNKSTGNAAIVFSVRNEDVPLDDRSLRGIRPITQKLINELPRRSIGEACKVHHKQHTTQGNSPTLAQYAKKYQDHLNDPEWLQRELRAMLTPPEISPRYNPRTMAPDEYRFQLRQTGNAQYDYLLAEAILRGFGFIIGSGSVSKNIQGFDPERHARSILLTQKLFENGNIYFLLGTNAIGVGATLTIKNMYLPSLQGFFGGKMQSLDDSSLVQVINRLGRKTGITANLHCSPADYDKIVRFMFEHPQSQVTKDVHIWPFKKWRNHDQIAKLASFLRLMSRTETNISNAQANIIT